MTKFCIERDGFTRLATVSVLVVSAIGLSGCLSSPTYGTGKPASEQLLEDVTGVLTVGPKKREQIDYKPRPELVQPAEVAGLPEPQENVISSAQGVWPESPEEQRARLRAEATKNRDNLGWRPKIKGPENAETVSAAQYDRNPNLVMDNMTANTDAASRQRALNNPDRRWSDARGDRGTTLTLPDQNDPDAQREEFNRRLAANNQGDAKVRKYLSEPPLEYRAPADTAPVNDVGEDEYKKEAKRKANSRKKAGKWSWRDLVPWS
ncbi:MAG: hypothetical protein AB3N20_17470 [Rhizobiaceae bacterium]